MRTTSFRLMRGLLAGAFMGMMFLVAHAGPKEDIQDDMKSGRWAQAEERLVVVLEKHPTNPLAHYWRAQVKAKLGDMAAAREELAVAKRIDPSLKFAGSPAALAKLEAIIAAPEPVPSVAEASSPDDLVAPLTGPQGMPAQPVELESAVEDGGGQHDNVWFFTKLLLGLAATGVAIQAVWVFVFARRAEGKRLQQAREHWTVQLRDAKAVLDDAIKKSDGNITLTPEARLANYDRCNAARTSIATQLGSIGKAENFREAELAVVRANDIAAEVRGEETPTVRAERRMDEARAELREAQERAVLMAASRPREVHHYSDSGSSRSGGGGSLLRDAALIGGGVLLANAMTSSASAKENHPSGDDSLPSFEPIDTGENQGADNGIDLDGTVAGGDDSFDSDSSNVDTDFS